MTTTTKSTLPRLGCNPDPKEQTYRLFKELTPAEVAALPTSFTIEEAAKIPVYDQGALGSCTSFASGTSFEILSQVLFGQFETSAHLQIYQCELVHDGNPRNSDVGSSLSTAAWVLENKGVAPESELPYDTTKFGQPIPTNVLADAVTHELIKDFKLDVDGNLQATINNTKSAISNKYPVMFGMNWYSSFDNTRSDGNIPTLSGDLRGGHALCLFAYDDNHVNGPGRPNGAFRGRNSWSATFGFGGDYWLGYDIILNINDGFSDAHALMSETGFQPNPVPPTPNPTPQPVEPQVDNIDYSFREVSPPYKLVALRGTAYYKQKPVAGAHITATINNKGPFPKYGAWSITTNNKGDFTLNLAGLRAGAQHFTLTPGNGPAVQTAKVWL